MEIWHHYDTEKPFRVKGINAFGENYEYDGHKYDWFVVTEINLNGPEPDWKNIEKIAEEKRERIQL